MILLIDVMSYLAALAIQTDPPIQVKVISPREAPAVRRLRFLSTNGIASVNETTTVFYRESCYKLFDTYGLAEYPDRMGSMV